MALIGSCGFGRWLDGKRVSGGFFMGIGLLFGLVATIPGGSGRLPWQWWNYLHRKGDENDCRKDFQCHVQNVTQKHLTSGAFVYYSKDVANVLPIEKQTAIIGSPCEGFSIRAIGRMTGVHRDTVMRLGVRVGQGCTAMVSETLRRGIRVNRTPDG
jgi:hypothetical protein